MHLPTIDFRAYAIGKNIQEGMLVPEDAPKAIQEFTWTFKVNGEEQVYKTDGSYPSVEGDFIGVETKIIEEGYSPPVVDFSIETDEEDLTTHFLAQDNLVVVVSYNLESIEKAGALKLKALQDEARKNNYQIIGLTASGEAVKQRINDAYNLDFSWYLCDEKALKTVVRSNPGILELDKGLVQQKVHWNDIEDLQLPEVEKRPEPKPVDANIAYFINKVPSTKEAVEAIDPDTIESVNVIKDAMQLEALNTKDNTAYTSIIEVKLKDE